ncbi:MAG: hypothetical protein GY925_20950 [Actinomycetia bacterium]|nr:hypothetical protein [Actinomycetes bacterium]
MTWWIRILAAVVVLATHLAMGTSARPVSAAEAEVFQEILLAPNSRMPWAGAPWRYPFLTLAASSHQVALLAAPNTVESFDASEYVAAVIDLAASDGCTTPEIEPATATVDELRINVRYHRPRDAFCTQAIVIFRAVVLLRRSDLPETITVVERDTVWINNNETEREWVSSFVTEDILPRTPVTPIVDVALTPDDGAWLADPAGGVYAMGGAQFHGSTGGLGLAAPVVAISATPTGDGYWLFGADGGVFAYGDAEFHGSIPGALPAGASLVAPIVDADPTASGDGYWLVGADGGVFAFGDATFHGRGGSHGEPIVGIGPALDDSGYVLVDGRGSIEAFGGPASQGELEVYDHFGRVDTGDDVSDIAPIPSRDNSLWRITREHHGSPPVPDGALCPPGTSPSTAIAHLSPNGWTTHDAIDDAIRADASMNDGHWLQLGTNTVDVYTGRQVSFLHDKGLDNEQGPGWRAFAWTDCE